MKKKKEITRISSARPLLSLGSATAQGAVHGRRVLRREQPHAWHQKVAKVAVRAVVIRREEQTLASCRVRRTVRRVRCEAINVRGLPIGRLRRGSQARRL